MSDFLKFHRQVALYGPTGAAEWLFFFLLLPASTLYGVASWLRSRLYDWQLLASEQAAVPVISVGNLVVGGTGKTPVVDWLVKEFLALGKKPAVVSRGYGGSFSGVVGVVSKGDGLLLEAAVSGDEPFLLARRNPAALVLIARKRVAGVKLAVKELGAEVVILDDGFQHHAVRRDLDLVLLDASVPVGNRWPLPAGLLREFPIALRRADLLLLTRAEADSQFSCAAIPVFKSRHQLTDFALSLEGEEIALEQLKEMNLCAFAGIAKPESFFSALSAAGLQLGSCLSFSDHCKYDHAVQTEIVIASKGCDALITTEKDAVKLAAEDFDIPCYQVPMRVSLENEAVFKAAIQQRLWSE